MESFELPFITQNLKGIGGKLKETSESFIVEEVPVYEACGEGEHLFVNLTKEGLNTKEVVDKLRELFSLKREDVGVAGLKDREARTSQTISLRFGNYSSVDLEKIKEQIEEQFLDKGKKRVQVNWFKKHNNKLRPGHLLGNRFKIFVSELNCGLDEAEKRAEKIIDKIIEGGLPNYYGEQRFGQDGDNWQRGLDILNEKQKIYDKWLRSFLLSSVQSYLCNLYLKERILQEKYSKLMDGDVVKKTDTGGVFVVEKENLKREQERFDKREIVFTCPIYGDNLMQGKENTEAKMFEDKILEMVEIKKENMKYLSDGLRRQGILLFKKGDIVVEKDGKKNGLWFSFFLPKGSFATVLLREVMKG